MAELADISDLLIHLQTAQDKILERLAATKEYQALLTVEKAIQDLAQVLEVVADGENFDVEPAPLEEVSAKEESSDIASLPVAEAQQAVDQTAGAASSGETPVVEADETAAVTATTPVIQSHDASGPASSVEAAGEQAGKSIWNPTARFSTLGLVEEWRLTTMVRKSFSANGGNDDALFAGEGTAKAEKAKVA